MKRYNKGEKPQISSRRVPYGQGAMVESYWEPYEKVEHETKNYNLIKVVDGSKTSYYIEHKFTKTKTTPEAGKNNYEFWQNAKTHLEYLEEHFANGQSTPSSIPGQEPPAQKADDNEPSWYKTFREEAAKIEASFKEFNEQLRARDTRIDGELARQKLAEMKETMSGLESQISKLAPQDSEPSNDDPTNDEPAGE